MSACAHVESGSQTRLDARDHCCGASVRMPVQMSRCDTYRRRARLSVATFMILAIGSHAASAEPIEELDFFLSPKWYVVSSDTGNTRDNLNFRLFAGISVIKQEQMMGGLANVLTFKCSKSGHSFHFDFPESVEITPFDGVTPGSGVVFSFANSRGEYKFQGRKSGNGVYIDRAGNADTHEKLELPELLDASFIISARGQRVSSKFIGKPEFQENVEQILQENGVKFKAFSEAQKDYECLKHMGIRIKGYRPD